jgi:hypothetical protein
MASAYLLIIGHREGLSWMLGTERMAFPHDPGSDKASLEADDQLLLYTTRGCFKNPTRDDGRVIGQATVTSAVTGLRNPVIVAGRTFPYGCSIRVESLAPLGLGVSLRTLTTQLDAFKSNPQAWSVWLRRTLLPLSDHDASLLTKRLNPLSQPAQNVIKPYLKWFPQKAEGREEQDPEIRSRRR